MGEFKSNYFAPILAFSTVIVLLIFLANGLKLNPRDVPSPLINKPVPEFELPDILNSKQTFSKQDLLGKISLVNIWATWCPSCRDEHEVLLRISQTGKVKVYGIDWKDTPEKAKKWLRYLGNPYVKNGSDQSGYVAIDFGVIAAPETYLVNRRGIIVYKHTGPIDWSTWRNVILPKINELNESA